MFIKGNIGTLQRAKEVMNNTMDAKNVKQTDIRDLLKKNGRERNSVTESQEVEETDLTEKDILEVFAVSGISKEKTLEIAKKLKMRKPMPRPFGCNQPHSDHEFPYLLGAESLQKKQDGGQDLYLP